MKRRSGPRRSKEKAENTGVIFSRNLRRFCRSEDLTAEVIAKRLGFDLKRVERLLAGEIVPGLALIGTISRKLGAPLDELLCDL